MAYDSLALVSGKERVMSDLIKREDAIKAVLGLTMYKGCVPVDSVIFNIKKIPTINADRPKGEWIKDAEWWCVYKCSVCGETFDELTNFCPYCGADMRGEDNE